MSVSNKSIFVCPACHGMLKTRESALCCASCGAQYPVREGIPVFTEDGDVRDLEEMQHLVERLESMDETAFPDPAARFRLPNRPFSLARHRTEKRAFDKFFRKYTDLDSLRILDISCGVGREAQMLLAAGATDITLLDISFPAVAYTRKTFPLYYPDRRLLYCVSDAAQLPFPDNTFDLVLVYASAHHYPDFRRFLSEVTRVSARLCLISEPARIVPLEGMMRYTGWNTEYGGLDTHRFHERRLRNQLKGAGMRYEIQRRFQYFPKMFDPLGDVRPFVVVWFGFLRFMELVCGRWLGHSLNVFAERNKG